MGKIDWEQFAQLAATGPAVAAQLSAVERHVVISAHQGLSALHARRQIWLCKVALSLLVNR